MTGKMRKAVVVLIILVIVSGTVGGLHVSYRRAKNAVIAQAKTVLSDSAKEQVQTLATQFETDYLYMELLADSSAFENERTGAQTSRMLGALREHSNFSYVYILGTDGAVEYGDISAQDCSNCGYFQTALSGQRAIGSADVSDGIAGAGIVLAVPYYENGGIAGVLCCVYDKDDLAELLCSQAFSGLAYSFIADSNGEVVIATAAQTLLAPGQNLADFFAGLKGVPSSETDAASAWQQIAQGKSVTLYFSINGDGRVFAAVPLQSSALPQSGWTLCNVVAAGVLEEQIESSRGDSVEVIKVIVAFSIVALALFVWLERDDLKRIKKNAGVRKDFLDNLPCGAGIYEMSGNDIRLIYLNKRYREMVGRGKDELEVADVTKAVHPDDVAALLSELKAARAENRDGIQDIRILMGNGSYAPFRIIGRIAENKDGKQIFYCVYFPYENGQFEAEYERQQTEMRYRELVENSGGGLTITELDGDGNPVNLFTSDGMLRLMHYTRQQWESLPQDSIYDKVHPDDVEAVRAVYEHIKKDGESSSAVYRLICADGSYVWVSVTGRLAIENGRKYTYAVHTDVSAQKQAELRVRNISEQLAFLNRVAADLLREPDPDLAINIVLKDILEHFSGNRAYVFEFDNRKQTACNTYELCAPGVEPAIEMLECVPFAVFSQWFDLFEEYGHIAIDDTAHLSAHRVKEKELLKAQNISSLLVVPLKVGGKYIGMMGVDDPKQDVDQMGRLQAVGDYISVLLSRRDILNELSESNRNMQTMMGDTPGGFAQMEIHEGNRITPSFINDGFCRMLGMSRQQTHELFDSDAYAGAHPDDRKKVGELLADIIARRATLNTRVRLQNADGDYIPVEAYYRAWENSQGKLLLNGYYRDISDKVALEENYRRNLAYRDVTGKNAMASFHLNVTQNTIDEGISDDPELLALGEDGTFEGFIAKGASVRLDFTAGTEYRKTFSRHALLTAAAQGTSQITLESAISTARAGELWVRSVVNLFKNPRTGDVEGFIYARDMTQEHLLGQMMNTIVNVGYDFIVCINLEHRSYHTFISNLGITTAFKENGIYDDEDTVFELLKIVHPQDRESAHEHMMLSNIEHELEQHSYYEFHYRVVVKDKVRHKKCTCAYIGDDRSNILIARTDETAAVQKMQSALEAAQKASVAKSEFLSHISHEIRTPMNAVIGMAELARDSLGTNDKHAAEYLDEIGNSSQYLLALINDILDMSRIESGKSRLVENWVAPADIINSCVEIIAPAITKKNITFKYTDLAADSGFNSSECFVDAMKVQQMLINLLNNACKFTGENGHITLDAKLVKHDRTTGSAIISVQDDGCGMSKEFLEKLFQPFEQESNVYTGSIQGTGLGLTIAKRIAQEMGGDITVTSELGHGSKFTVTVPFKYRKKNSAAPKKAKAEKETPLELSGKRVLMCEDNHINATIAERLLENKGCKVDCAENGRLGVEKFLESAPNYYDAVLMDIRMPQMDGLQAAKAMRAAERPDAKTVPIIALSANAFSEDVQKSYRAGMNAHLAKPIDPETLFRVLSEQIEKRAE